MKCRGGLFPIQESQTFSGQSSPSSSSLSIAFLHNLPRRIEPQFGFFPLPSPHTSASASHYFTQPRPPTTSRSLTRWWQRGVAQLQNGSLVFRNLSPVSKYAAQSGAMYRCMFGVPEIEKRAPHLHSSLLLFAACDISDITPEARKASDARTRVIAQPSH